MLGELGDRDARFSLCVCSTNEHSELGTCKACLAAKGVSAVAKTSERLHHEIKNFAEMRVAVGAEQGLK
jgi:hypothetical protein